MEMKHEIKMEEYQHRRRQVTLRKIDRYGNTFEISGDYDLLAMIATKSQVVAKEDIEALGFPRVIFIKMNSLLRCFWCTLHIKWLFVSYSWLLSSLIWYLLFALGWRR